MSHEPIYCVNGVQLGLFCAIYHFVPMYNSVIRDNDQGDHVEVNERCMIADASDVGLRHKVEKSAVQFFFFL